MVKAFVVMKVYAIGDLHLSSSGEKPMDVFGPEWAGHDQKIAANWRALVAPDDLVLICGDLSWAMRLPEALADLALIDSLPGVKYFIRGNHDYWCAGAAPVRRAVGPSMHYVRNDAAVYRGVGICGERGWTAPGHPDFDPAEDARHWQRAAIRLGLSLEALGPARLAGGGRHVPLPAAHRPGRHRAERHARPRRRAPLRLRPPARPRRGRRLRGRGGRRPLPLRQRRPRSGSARRCCLSTRPRDNWRIPIVLVVVLVCRRRLLSRCSLLEYSSKNG